MAEDHKIHFQKESARNRCSTAMTFLIAYDAWEMRYELNFVDTLGKKNLCIFISHLKWTKYMEEADYVAVRQKLLPK